MDSITRQQAIMHGLTKYFTGIPCKNGHTAQRYTRCAVCVECLHPTINNQDLVERRESRRRNLRAQARMIRIKVTLHKDDAGSFLASAHLLATSREPSITADDLLTRFAPRLRAVDTFMYAIKCFPEDSGTLYSLQESLSFARLSPALQRLVRDAAARRIS